MKKKKKMRTRKVVLTACRGVEGCLWGCRGNWRGDNKWIRRCWSGKSRQTGPETARKDIDFDFAAAAAGSELHSSKRKVVLVAAVAVAVAVGEKNQPQDLGNSFFLPLFFGLLLLLLLLFPSLCYGVACFPWIAVFGGWLQTKTDQGNFVGLVDFVTMPSQ